MSAADALGLLLFFAAVLFFMLWTARLPHHCFPRPHAIRFRFDHHGARRRRYWWRNLRRAFMDINDLQVGETRTGTLAITDQNGAILPDAEFDAAPALNSTDNSVVTIAAGATFKDIAVSGVSAGSAGITADGSSGGVVLQQGVAIVTVIVLPNGAFGISIEF
jgi:hypothetical protein